MYSGKIVFSQLMEFLPLHDFRKCVDRYHGNHRVRELSCLDQFLIMAFAQLTYRESLRDIETCLRSMQSRLYHMGIRSWVSRSTLADANELRDWRIYADFAQILIAKARHLYAGDALGVDLDNIVYALDTTTIDLCLALFPWARFRKTKAAVKLHTLLNLRGIIPEFIHVSDGAMHEIHFLDMLIPVAGAFYIMDRGFLDFSRLYTLHQAQAFFIIRAKSNFRFERRYSRPVDKSTGLQCDQSILLKTFYPAHEYPDPLRRIRYFDALTQKRLVFLTNHFGLPALTIARLYKARWQIELFFKWIKQHLRIKAFYGTSENAVKTQVWSAISVYLMVAILKKELHLDQSLYTILQILSISIFEKLPINQLLTENQTLLKTENMDNQLSLFKF